MKSRGNAIPAAADWLKINQKKTSIMEARSIKAKRQRKRRVALASAAHQAKSSQRYGNIWRKQ